MKKIGTTKSKANVPIVMPPTTPVANELLPLAPAPVENIKGNIPDTIVKTVIKIGRKRAWAAE